MTLRLVPPKAELAQGDESFEGIGMKLGQYPAILIVADGHVFS